MSLIDLIPAPYSLIAKIAVPILIVAGAYIAGDIHGHRAGAASVQAIYQKAADKALAAMQRGRAAIYRVDGLYVAARAAQSTETGNIRRDAAPIILRPIYSTVCVDADGIGLLDRARANANRTPATGPDGAARGTAGDAPQP